MTKIGRVRTLIVPRDKEVPASYPVSASLSDDFRSPTDTSFSTPSNATCDKTPPSTLTIVVTVVVPSPRLSRFSGQLDTRMTNDTRDDRSLSPPALDSHSTRGEITLIVAGSSRTRWNYTLAADVPLSDSGRA